MPSELNATTWTSLGYVEHESSDAKRELRDSGPLVELLITTKVPSLEDDPRAEQDLARTRCATSRNRIILLKQTTEDLQYSDIALLFRAMTHVQIYESVFRRANIPYQTVLGRGFYEREEITDLIQLLRFLDNKTDELALAAVLRSPLCGISDNALAGVAMCAESSPKLRQLIHCASFSANSPLFRRCDIMARLHSSATRNTSFSIAQRDLISRLDSIAGIITRFRICCVSQLRSRNT